MKDYAIPIFNMIVKAIQNQKKKEMSTCNFKYSLKSSAFETYRSPQIKYTVRNKII